MNVDKLLSEAKYTFAKTMAEIPHFYTLKKDWNAEEFEEAVRHIHKNGEQGKFYNKTYTYYYADGWKYWTMTYDVDATILINREKVK